MWLRAFTLLAWAAVAASALFWGLKLWAKPPAAPAGTQVAAGDAATRGDLSRVLGVDAAAPAAAEAPEPATDARFTLVGVVSPRNAQAAREGVALIAVDGKPAKAFRVGAVVDGTNVLQSVSARGASLGPRGGAPLVALNIPPPAPAATGQLQGATNGAANGASPVPGVPGMPGLGNPARPPGAQPVPPALPPAQSVPPQITLPPTTRIGPPGAAMPGEAMR
jgi:general secretion pathway protein C